MTEAVVGGVGITHCFGEEFHILSFMDEWIADVEACVVKQAPDLLSLFVTYAGEARFGRQYIATDLLCLPHGATLLEVGAGCFLLSCQLVREGYQVTAVEPTGSGFSHFNRMRRLILERAQSLGCLPMVLDIPAERLSERNCFDFAFSINVMEHVEDIGATLASVSAGLKPGGHYRFTCPNYLFPYEPHFNIPTLFSKELTERFFRKRIFTKDISDPMGTWKSINWINVRTVSALAKRLPGFKVSFKRTLLASTLERIVLDEEFASRRPKWIRAGISGLVRLRLHYLAASVPALFQPIIDCVMTKDVAGKAV